LSETDVDDASRRELQEDFTAALEAIRPAVVVIPGWSARWALVLLATCRRMGLRTVVMSDSNADDARRTRIGEAVKARLVQQFDAGFVGGTRAADYLAALGLPRERITLGYDVVDNAHFAAPKGAALDAVRSCAPSKPFFLSSARFVPKKNLPGLLDAYAAYRRRVGTAAWDLVVLGDGEGRAALENQRSALGLDDVVHLPGFTQYPELPAWYALAAAFVLPSMAEQWGLVVNEAMAAGRPVLVSERCGCAADLVRDGVNGFTFDPSDLDTMAGLMAHIAHGDVYRATMGQASREIIADWGPERFAEGLQQAVQAALCAPSGRLTPLHHMLLQALVRR
jgi:glycosyltransferase involved in cell wall biosynthesis